MVAKTFRQLNACFFFKAEPGFINTNYKITKCICRNFGE